MLARIIDFPSKDGGNADTPSLGSILGFLNRVSAIADQNEPFKTATTRIFAEVCTYTDWPIAHLYIRDPENPQRYIANDIWFLEDRLDGAAIKDFVQMSEETVFDCGKGLIGIIAQEHKAKAVEDVTILTQFLRADAAQRSGVRGFFGFPVMVNGECVGVAEFYSRHTGLLDETSLEIMQYVSSQLGRVYERDTNNQHQQLLISQFQTSVQGAIEQLVDGSEELEKVGNGVQQQVSNNDRQCTQVSQGADSISQNMATLQQAMQQLLGIEGETQSASHTVKQTVEELAQNISTTLAQLQGLGKVTARIETIAKNVAEVSGQVRMLGLNASIEAARAGAAGKGFAIVAGEIKSLAQQSEASSQDISSQLSDILNVTDQSIRAIQNVAQSMTMLEECTGRMSGCVDSQHEATETIRHNLDDAQNTFDAISKDIDGMGTASNDLLKLAEISGNQVQTIKELVGNISTASTDFINELES